MFIIGMGDRHNGINFMRAACVIAMEKAQMSFEPMLESLRTRTAHIMKRLFPVVEEMIRKSSLIRSVWGFIFYYYYFLWLFFPPRFESVFGIVCMYMWRDNTFFFGFHLCVLCIVYCNYCAVVHLGWVRRARPINKWSEPSTRNSWMRRWKCVYSVAEKIFSAWPGARNTYLLLLFFLMDCLLR